MVGSERPKTCATSFRGMPRSTAASTFSLRSFDTVSCRKSRILINPHASRCEWTNWFGGLTITLEYNGDTLLTGPVVDQAALHGLLRKVRDLGMPLISAIRVEPP